MVGNVPQFVTLSSPPNIFCYRQRRPLSFEALVCTTIAVNNIFHIVLPANIKIDVLLLAKGINYQAFN
jgi:hypothetical protein